MNPHDPVTVLRPDELGALWLVAHPRPANRYDAERLGLDWAAIRGIRSFEISWSSVRSFPGDGNADRFWVRDAACVSAPDVFYPEGHPPRSRSGEKLDATIARARAICRGCPVRDNCLEEALTQQEPFGIWGGLTPMERRVAQKLGCTGTADEITSQLVAASTALDSLLETEEQGDVA